jgi:hypothetical protein
MSKSNVKAGQRWRKPDGTHFTVDSVDPSSNTAVTTVHGVGVSGGAEPLTKFGSYSLLGQFRVTATGVLEADSGALMKRFGRDLVRFGYEPATDGIVASCEVEVWAVDAKDAESIAHGKLPRAEITSVTEIQGD